MGRSIALFCLTAIFFVRVSADAQTTGQVNLQSDPSAAQQLVPQNQIEQLEALASAASSARAVAEKSVVPTSRNEGANQNFNFDVSAKTSEVSAQPTTLNDLRSIGGLSLFFDPLSEQKSRFALNSQSNTLTASYRFPGASDSDDFYSPLPPPANRADKSGAPLPPVPVMIDLPKDVNMFVVKFIWCGSDNAKACGAPPLANYGAPGCPPTPPKGGCVIEVVFLRDLFVPSKPGLATGNLIPAFILSQEQLLVSETLLLELSDNAAPTYTINGFDLKTMSRAYDAQTRVKYPASNSGVITYSLRSGWVSISNFHFERYPADDSCRPYKESDEKRKEVIDAERPGYVHPNLGKDNGIIPFEPKVYDVFTLRQMLATTASQLAGISGFSQANITAAFGNLQGVTTQSSFISAQVTTAGTPAVSSTVARGTSSGNTVGNAGVTCGAGTLLGTDSSGQPTCLPATGATAPGTGSTTGGSNSITSGGTSSNSKTTTSGGLTGTVAPTLTPTLPTAPTNVGVSASDILTEQVELNSQITSLELALQGALSDQYLVKGGKTLGTRQQTTLGFNISLNPPRRYKHAVAEVKVWIFPARQGDEIGVVNLLPAAKTYNVAKITSSQNQFGAGVVIDAINVGASGGKSKNRLYLAKDTDTVAVQYFPDIHMPKAQAGNVQQGVPAAPPVQLDTWSNGAVPIGRSPQEHVFDFGRTVSAWQVVHSSCGDDPSPDLVHGDPQQMDNPRVFGWQFRPVLGANYVQGGIRTVFAQLALPVGLGMQYAPHVFIQTLWRDYDEKKQVVGAVYSGSCSVVEQTTPIEVVSPLKVHTVAVDDMGGGVLKVSAQGEFLAQGFSVLSGQNSVGPTTFDGSNIQFFGNAANLLMTDDLNLVAEDGRLSPIGMQGIDAGNPSACNITRAELRATPRPDGNSMVEATIKSGPRFALEDDGPLKPLFLIGTQVYGLHESPFLETPDRACRSRRWEKGVTCTYHFLASTDVLRAAESFTVRDLAWMQLKKSGKIDFDPSFSSLTLLASNQTPAPDNTAPIALPTPGAKGLAPKLGTKLVETPAKPSAPGLPPVYTLTGADLLQVPERHNLNCVRSYFDCLEVYQGLTRFTLTESSFQVASKTNAVISVVPPTPAPFITLGKTTRKKDGKSISVTQLTINDASGGSTVFFTKDGKSNPDTTLSDKVTTVYSGPFSLNAAVIIKAVAVSPGQVSSGISTTRIVKGSDGQFVAFSTSPAPASKLSYKSYRFVWHPAYGAPVEWDLPIPSATPSAVTASTILNESDSTEVTFSNVQVLPNSAALPITFAFDGTVLPAPIFKYDSVAMTVKILITSAMTAKPGHKELLMNGYTLAPGTSTASAVQIELPFDVTRR